MGIWVTWEPYIIICNLMTPFMPHITPMIPLTQHCLPIIESFHKILSFVLIPPPPNNSHKSYRIMSSTWWLDFLFYCSDIFSASNYKFINRKSLCFHRWLVLAGDLVGTWTTYDTKKIRHQDLSCWRKFLQYPTEIPRPA